MKVNGNAVYAGGEFTTIGGQPRNYLAALDTTTGLATIWNPQAGDGVHALLVSGSTVYVGGRFISIGGKPQGGIASMGDLTTPTLLSLVSALATPDRVTLTWFSADRSYATATVYKRTATEGWSALGQVSPNGTGEIIYQDSEVVAGARYGYRLGVPAAGGETFMGETWVDVPRNTQFALAGARPNPARNDLTIAFSLPGSSPARLDVMDIAGRMVVTREVGSLGLGSHVLKLTDGRTLSAGVYLVRLSQGRRVLTTRAVIVR